MLSEDDNVNKHNSLIKGIFDVYFLSFWAFLIGCSFLDVEFSLSGRTQILLSSKVMIIHPQVWLVKGNSICSSQEEKDYLNKRFTQIPSVVNPETAALYLCPGTD